jgi:hypothetical protein
MAVRIIPRLARGRLFFEFGPILFPSFAAAVSAWSAAECCRLDIVEIGGEP